MRLNGRMVLWLPASPPLVVGPHGACARHPCSGSTHRPIGMSALGQRELFRIRHHAPLPLFQPHGRDLPHATSALRCPLPAASPVAWQSPGWEQWGAVAFCGSGRGRLLLSATFLSQKQTSFLPVVQNLWAGDGWMRFTDGAPHIEGTTYRLEAHHHSNPSAGAARQPAPLRRSAPGPDHHPSHAYGVPSGGGRCSGLCADRLRHRIQAHLPCG